MHDYNLERMTGCDKMLKELTAAELQKLHLNGTEERVPTLKEVLDIVKGKVPLLIELKGESTDVSLCPKANEILKDYGGKYIIESFNPLMLRLVPQKQTGRCARNSHYQYRHEKKHTPSNFVLGCNDAQRRRQDRILSPTTSDTADIFRYGSQQGCSASRSFGWTVSSEEGMKISKEENAYPILSSVIPK